MSIFLDYAATAPLREEVLDAMLPHLRAAGGNPSAMYGEARKAKQAVEEARSQIAACIGASPGEIYFTSGGTEANNWALRCLATPGGRLVTSQTEHPSVGSVAKALQHSGYEVEFLPAETDGAIRIAALEEALKRKTDLVSVMFINNEVGTRNPMEKIAAACEAAGVPLHTDAVAAAGKEPLDVHAQGISLLSASAHKFQGPQGTGFLFLSEELKPRAMMQGGHQERSLRPGTENVAGIVGMAVALRLACEKMDEERGRLAALREHLKSRLEAVPGIRINGSPSDSLASILHLTLPGIRSESALIFLDSRNIACGAGAACSLGAGRPSHVLLAMGQSEEEAACALRVSFGHETEERHLDLFADALQALITRHTQSRERTVPPPV